MTLVLDAGGITALVGQRARLELRRRGLWPPQVPAVVAFASSRPNAMVSDVIVLTSDPRDLAALAEHAAQPVVVAST